MNDLLILKAFGDDSARSPEFRYLLSLSALHAREAFGRAELAVDGPPPERRFDAVLLLSGVNVLLARRSLEAMRDRLLAGAAEVRPYRLADTGLAGRFPVYTLRGYERLERAFLEEAAADVPLPPDPPAVCLLRWDEYERRSAGLPAASHAAHAGLCHEFIDYYGEVRADILPFVPPEAREVLEVGCGRGATGRLLQERLGCRVTGVELNPVVAEEAARHLHRVLQGDVQTLDLDGRFDVVLALELVEHLVDSESFLARVRQLLAPGGRAIFSIPNVGHWSIVEDLLAGRWDYLPIGLLCYTHYRFFTRHSLAAWLRRSGIERFELVPQRTELPDRFLPLAGSFETDPESLSTQGFYVVVYQS